MQKKLIGSVERTVSDPRMVFVSSLVALISMLNSLAPNLVLEALRILEVLHEGDDRIDINIIRNLLADIKKQPAATVESIQ